MLDVTTNRNVIDDTTVDFGPRVKMGSVLHMDAQAAAPASIPGFVVVYSLAADGRLYYKDVAGTQLAVGTTGGAMQFKGAIALPVDFPTAALVENGWTYRVTTNVIDNDGTRTNTGQSFMAGADIAWNGTDWTELGASTTVAPVISTMAGLALQTLGSAGTAALNGFLANTFVPERVVIVATAAPGTQNGDAQIIVGTTLHGTELCPAHPIPITVVGGSAVIVLEGGFPAIAGNAALFAEVSTADTNGLADITATVRVIGRQY